MTPDTGRIVGHFLQPPPNRRAPRPRVRPSGDDRVSLKTGWAHTRNFRHHVALELRAQFRLFGGDGERHAG